MSSTVWIVTEDDDTGKTHWWSVDHHDTEEEAIDHAEEIAADIENHTGNRPSRLDD